MELTEKVILGLKCCLALKDNYCDNCPYSLNEWECDKEQLKKDALALLKAQEPRLVTEADFENADPYGYLPVWVEDMDDSEIICDCITKHAITEPDEDCHYRFWTFRPTEAQRKAVKWE